MRRAECCGAAIVSGLFLAALYGTAAPATTVAVSAPLECPAALVHRDSNDPLSRRWIVPSPASAGITGGVPNEVDGRVAIYAGGVNPVTGTNEKILWTIDPAKHVGSSLQIVGQRVRVTAIGRLRAVSGSFRLKLYEAVSEQATGHLFPSIIAPPRAGCWRLTFRTGPTSARLIIRALPVPR